MDEASGIPSGRCPDTHEAKANSGVRRWGQRPEAKPHYKYLLASETGGRFR